MSSAILLSGGIDSTALTYLFRNEISLAITIDYGQKSARTEVEVSKRLCSKLNLQHEVLKIDCSKLGGGIMSKSLVKMSDPLVNEFWPFRNQLLITLAAMKAVQFNISHLLIGTVKSDKKFVDGTKRFFKAFNKCLSMQEGNLILEAPAIGYSSKKLVLESGIPDDLLLWTHSCHISNNPCGGCNGCNKYLKVMKSLGIN